MDIARADAREGFKRGLERSRHLGVRAILGNGKGSGFAPKTELDVAESAGEVETEDGIIGGTKVAVDLDDNALPFRGDAIKADKLDGAGVGFEGHPTPVRVGAVSDEREGEVALTEAESEGAVGATIKAGEGVDIGGTDKEEIGVNGLAVAAGDRATGLFEGYPAREREESGDVKAEVAHDPSELTLRSVHVERERVRRTGG